MKLLFIGTDWISKQIITEMLFEDEEEELELAIIGQDTPEWFWIEFPQLKTYMGDERVNYQQVTLAQFGESYIPHAVYITDTEPAMLNGYLAELEKHEFKGPIILASSWQVYGFKKKKRTPIKETERELNPENNSAKRLLALEQVMLKYKSLQTVILRYSEVFGPYMPETSELINMMIDCLSSEEIDVYPPPSRNYDWLHVKFIYNLVPKLFNRKFIGGGEIYNIGSGEEKKITWLANSLRQLANSQVPIKIHEPPNFNIEARGYHSLLDIDKARRFLQLDSDGIRINYFLEVLRWVEHELPEGRRVPNLEETYPMLREDFGTDKLKVVDDTNQEIEINHGQ